MVLKRPALMDPIKQISDDYWNLLTQVRDKKEGPDGITIWNIVHRHLKETMIRQRYQA